MVAPMKSCPYCAEPIQQAAIVCKHCSRDVRPRQPARNLILFMLIVGVLAMVTLLIMAWLAIRLVPRV